MLEVITDFWHIWLIILIGLITFIIAAVLYTIVPADKADVVIQRGKRRTFSPHPEYTDVNRAAYFKIPAWVPGYGMVVHRMPLKILSIPIPDFLAFDKDRARFVCDIVAYGVIKDPVVAAMRFPGSIEELGTDISKVVRATTRDSTTKKPIREIINDREGIIDTINAPLTDALKHWGIELRDIELVEFKDPEEPIYKGEEPPHVIKDISSIIEVQINSEARQKNAEQIKIARLKEAEAEELAKKREIQKDEQIGMREQKKNQEVAKEQKLAREQELEVTKVQQVKTQQIEKERAIVEANQKKEVENINKEKKHLEGQGDYLMQMEQAKGKAEFVRQQGYADADAKERLQQALNKFKDEAIRALVAEKLVEMQKEVGIAGAKALEVADLRVFSGGSGSKQGFELGEMIESIMTSSSGTAGAVLNRLSRPNDLGFKDWGTLLGAFQEYKKEQEAEQTAKKEQKKDASFKQQIEQKKTAKTDKPKRDLP